MSLEFVFDGTAYTPSTPLQFNFAPTTTFTHTASGGAVTGGTAGFSTTAAPAVGGDLVSGGSATVALTFAHDTAGGVTAGGAADVLRTFTHTASGGAEASGAADAELVALAEAPPVSRGGLGTLIPRAFRKIQKPRPSPAVFTHDATGGPRTGGSAACALASVPTQTFSHSGQGGKRVAGLAIAGHVDTLAAIRAENDEALLLGILAA